MRRGLCLPRPPTSAGGRGPDPAEPNSGAGRSGRRGGRPGSVALAGSALRLRLVCNGADARGGAREVGAAPRGPRALPGSSARFGSVPGPELGGPSPHPPWVCSSRGVPLQFEEAATPSFSVQISRGCAWKQSQTPDLAGAVANFSFWLCLTGPRLQSPLAFDLGVQSVKGGRRERDSKRRRRRTRIRRRRSENFGLRTTETRVSWAETPSPMRSGQYSQESIVFSQCFPGAGRQVVAFRGCPWTLIPGDETCWELSAGHWVGASADIFPALLGGCP